MIKTLKWWKKHLGFTSSTSTQLQLSPLLPVLLSVPRSHNWSCSPEPHANSLHPPGFATTSSHVLLGLGLAPPGLLLLVPSQAMRLCVGSEAWSIPQMAGSPHTARGTAWILELSLCTPTVLLYDCQGAASGSWSPAGSSSVRVLGARLLLPSCT